MGYYEFLILSNNKVIITYRCDTEVGCIQKTNNSTMRTTYTGTTHTGKHNTYSVLVCKLCFLFFLVLETC